MDSQKFETLKPEEQTRIFHHSPFKERGELLLHAHDPQALTRSLSREEFYLVTREMDLEERAEVLRYATLGQLFFISDIDCWKKDRLSPQGFLNWLEVLARSDEKRLLAWLAEMDYEAVVSGFKKLIRVLKPEREYAADEILGDTPYFTLDEQYFISVKEENLETVRQVLELLYENERGRYAALLEGILSEVDDMVEEEAYRRREMRLAERGFPDPETARKIYRPLAKGEFEKFPLKNQREGHSNSGTTREEPPIPHYPVLWSHERLFLDEVLFLFRDVDPKIREGLEEELAWLSNKVIASEGVDFSSEERVRRGVERARDFVSIGLEDLSGRDLARARKLLTERWLEIIFRSGVTRILKLRDRALELIRKDWKGPRESFLAFLNPPYEFIFRGLVKTVPECYDPEIREALLPLRDFQNIRDVDNTALALHQMEKIFGVLTAQAAYDLEQYAAMDTNGDFEPSLFSLLGTGFAHFGLEGKIGFRPLPVKEIPDFLNKAFEKNGTKRVLKRGLLQAFQKKLAGEAAELASLWPLVFENLEEEFASLNLSKPFEPRFISSLYMTQDVTSGHRKNR